MPVDIGTTVPTSDMKKPVATRAFSLAKDWASPWRSEAMPQWLSLSRPAMPRSAATPGAGTAVNSAIGW